MGWAYLNNWLFPDGKVGVEEMILLSIISAFKELHK
jgi:hypothetical protein